MRKDKKKEDRKVLCLSFRGPIYERLKALCLEEAQRRREPMTVCRFIREIIVKTVEHADKQ